MKVKKADAFVIGLAAIALVDIGGLVAGNDPSMGSLTAIVALCTAYMGANVADNGVKGRFYEPQLDRDPGK